MASLDDLKGILKSVSSSTMTQVNTLKSVINVQKRIDAGSNKFIDNSNLAPDTTAMKDTFEELIGLGKDQVKFLENIFKIQYEINEREKEALRVSKQPKTDTSLVTDKAQEPIVPKAGDKPQPRGAGGLEDLFGLPAGILAAVSALGLAFAGLRGWEVTAIKYVKDAFGGIGNSIVNGVKNIKNSILSVFGIDANGKPMPNSVLDSITKNPWIKKLTDGLSKILTPIKTMFGTVAENAGAFAKTVGKILKPLGFLFSAFDGIMAAINTEGDFLDKLGAFTSAFIGDFVGAPLDLLKDITAWVLEKFGFDGAAKYLKSFSFETLITDLVNGIFSTVGDAWRWLIGLLPSIDDIKKTMLSIMPDWMKELVGAPIETAAEIVDKKAQEEESELAEKKAKRAKIEASNKDRSTRVLRGVERPAAPLIDTSELDAEIAAAEERVSSPTQKIDIINQELKALRDEKEAIDAANAKPQVGRGGRPRIDTSSVVAKIKDFEAKLNVEMEKNANNKPVPPTDTNYKPAAVDTNARPDRLEGIFAEQQLWAKQSERLAQIVGDDNKPVTSGKPPVVEPAPVVGKMIPNLDISKEVAPLAFKTPSRADVIKAAAAAAAESAEIIEKPYSDVMQEDQNKTAGFMNRAEALVENNNNQNTNNVNYAPMTDARSSVYNGGSSTTNIYSSSSSKSDLNYGLPGGIQ